MKRAEGFVECPSDTKANAPRPAVTGAYARRLSMAGLVGPRLAGLSRIFFMLARHGKLGHPSPHIGKLRD